MKAPQSSVEFGTFERNVLSEQIAARLLEMIKDRKLRPGDRLPPERELAVMMQVSRPSLREALRALSVMGVIENRQGSGTYVTSLEPERLVENFNFILSLDLPTFIDVLEARKVIEVGLAAMAARKITDQQIQALEQCLEESERVLHDPEAFMACDLRIHQDIAEAAQNNILSTFMVSINQVNVYSRRRTVELPGVAQHSFEDHRRLVQALKSHNPEAASQAMLDHLNFVEQNLVEHGEGTYLDEQ
jgi:GntR family transcriptional repressor for pyruvate dehydrogenase complex